MTSTVLRTGRPLRLSTVEEQQAAGAIDVGGTNTMSWLGVPIPAGDRVIGVVGFENIAAHAYSEADERLLATLASSMGVALENARLFDETKRLLTETDERAAELAIINGVQQGLAAELDLQAMYDLVGDKIQEIFDAQVVDIGIFDHERGMISYPYTIERGVRFPDEPTPISFFARQLIATGEPVRVDDVSTLAPGVVTVTQGEAAKSMLMAPLIAGGDVRGRISLQNLDKTHAFSEADSRLLSTIASSLGVALENVRLFDETRRLLTETDERAAELAIINGVQQGLAAELDLQAMYDLVGDKIQEIFDAQVVDIAILDREANVFHFPYTIERGVRLPDEVGPMEGSIRADHARYPPADPDRARHRRERWPSSASRWSSRRGREVRAVGAAHPRRRDDRRDLAPEHRSRGSLRRRRRSPVVDDRVEPERRPRERAAHPRDPPACR